MQVRVFRNLTSRCLSIQARVGGGWRTVGHAAFVDLARARFCVSEAGRQRVLRTGKKSVHAWVQGDLIAWHGVLRTPGLGLDRLRGCMGFGEPGPLASAITYNPVKAASFVRRDDGAPVAEAIRAILSTTSGVTASVSV